jgi:hypothetical protein
MRNASVKGIIAAILIPASAGAVRADEATFTVVERATTNTIVDVGKPGDSEGDMLTFHNDLFDAENQILAVSGCRRAPRIYDRRPVRETGRLPVSPRQRRLANLP